MVQICYKYFRQSRRLRSEGASRSIMGIFERYTGKNKTKSDSIEARLQLLEQSRPGSPESELIEWLNHGHLEPEVIANRYRHYEELSRQTNEKIHARHDNQESIWLQNNYYIPVGIFYWSMQTHCHNIHPKGLSGDGQQNQPTLFIPEFTLDEPSLKQRLITDKDQRQQAIREHKEHDRRISQFCDDNLKSLPEAIRPIYSAPLHALASTHKNIAFCARLVDSYFKTGSGTRS